MHPLVQAIASLEFFNTSVPILTVITSLRQIKKKEKKKEKVIKYEK